MPEHLAEVVRKIDWQLFDTQIAWLSAADPSSLLRRSRENWEKDC